MTRRYFIKAIAVSAVAWPFAIRAQQSDPVRRIGILMNVATKYKLPAVYFYQGFVEDGGLMSYGPNDTDLFRRAAEYVGKILKGAKPAELPIEQPTKFDLYINLKTAKALGITISESFLARVDKIIE